MNRLERKISVAVLSATGTVGQRFVQLLANHPWFEISALCGSERSAGKLYSEACQWRLEGEIPAQAAKLRVLPLSPNIRAQIVFSALPSGPAKELEPLFAAAGYAVCTNASAFRQTENVPLLIPELNPDHLDLIVQQRRQKNWPGFITASPNCTTTGIAIPLKALDSAFGVKSVMTVSMQAISGAGHPGIASLDIMDNVNPFIRGEEEKIEPETQLLLGSMNNGQRNPHPLTLSAHCNRVPVLDGHTACISVKLNQAASMKEAAEALSAFRGIQAVQELPSAPRTPIIVRMENDRPQPRLDRDSEKGMAVTVGRLRECELLDLKFVSVVHNTLRGAASGAILNAELLVKQGYIQTGIEPAFVINI